MDAEQFAAMKHRVRTIALTLAAALITVGIVLIILAAAGWLMWLAPTTGGGPGLQSP